MKSVSRIVPNMCRILAHRYLQAFYIDWAQKVLPDILIKVSAVYIRRRRVRKMLVESILH